MTEPPSNFVSELRRRGVLRAAAAYGAGAFVLWQVAEIAVPALLLPPVVLTAVVLITLLGFPVVVILAWLYDVRVGRLVRDGGGEGEEGTDGDAPAPIGAMGLPGAVAVGVASGLVTVLLAGLWLTRMGSPDPMAPETTDPARVAIFPFVVRGDASLEYLDIGLVELLSVSLDDVGSLQIVDPNAVLAALPAGSDGRLDPERAREIAATQGAGAFVLGSVVSVGSGLRAQASLYGGDPEPELAIQASVGREDELDRLVDDLARQVVVHRVGAERAGRLARVATMTSTSFEALRDWLDGERAYQRMQHDSAAFAFAGALERDSTFALAAYRLGLSHGWSGRLAPGRVALSKATRFADRLSERDRLMLEGATAYFVGDATRAAGAYRRVIDAYPDEHEAWFWLGDALAHFNATRGRSQEEARVPLRRALTGRATDSEALFHLVTLPETTTEEIDSLAEAALAWIDNPGYRLAIAAGRLSRRGRADELRELLAGTPVDPYSAAFLSITMSWQRMDLGFYDPVVQYYDDPDLTAESRTLGVSLSSYLAAARGRCAEARSRADEVAASDQAAGLVLKGLLVVHPHCPSDERETRAVLRDLEALAAEQVPQRAIPTFSLLPAEAYPEARAYLRGVIHARLGEPDAALARADELLGFTPVPAASSTSRDLARRIRAEVALAAGEEAAALAELESNEEIVSFERIFDSPVHSGAHRRWLQGELLLGQGRAEEALRWFRSNGGAGHHDLLYHTAARIGEARSLAALGRSEEARATYAYVLRLWSDADDQLADAVGRVRKEMEALE